MRRHSLIAGLAGVAALLALPGHAAGATFSVTNLNDSGSGSLRKAIVAANATNAADTIAIKTTGTVQLAGALPDLETDMAIKGPGADRFTVRRNSGGDYRIFTVSGAAVVSISGLTATNGSESPGGGISEGTGSGKLTLSRVAVSANAVAGSQVRGGGIYNAGSLVVKSSTVSGNTATATTDSGEADGGGIYNDSGASLTLKASTVAANAATKSVAVADNFGGGILNEGTLSLTGDTISSSSGSGAGATNLWNGGTVTAEDTLIADAGSGGSDCYQNGGSITSLGHNLADDSGCFSEPSDVHADPGLEPLANYGGPTDTEAIPSGSPAQDAGVAAGLTQDQRGRPRPVDFLAIANASGGDGSDIGAFELGADTLCDGRQPTIVAAPAPSVSGTAHADVILGSVAGDTIKGLGGNDIICGGKGADVLDGGPGRDVLDGGPGTDTCRGGPGRDKLRNCEHGS